jgi:hypothetical protein
MALTAAAPATRATSSTEGQQLVAAAGVEATLNVRLPAGKTSYAIGELIPIELEFAGKGPSDIYFDTATYDRSGRLDIDQYDVSPRHGAVDPLDDFFRGGLSGFIGGGIRGSHPLDGTPFRHRVYLNEWVRFVQPARHEVRVTSGRLTRFRGGPVSQRIVAGPIELTIEAAPEGWADAELRRALTLIASRDAEASKLGTTILRHLGTKESGLAIVSHYHRLPDHGRFDAFAGLVASPHRAVLVAAMEERIATGEAIAGRFVEDLSFLRAFVEHPRDGGDANLRRTRYQELVVDYNRRWTAAFSARAATGDAIGTALKRLATGADEATMKALADVVARYPADAAPTFLKLSEETQRTLLEYRWPVMNQPWIRPVLEQLYSASMSQSRGVAAVALGRIVELDPASGRRLVLDEIANARHGIGFEALAILPDAALPELEAVLRTRLGPNASFDSASTAAWLLWRYGTDASVSFVSKTVGRPWACSIEAGLLAFLLKHQPSMALPRLAPTFDRRASGGCVVPPVAEIARRMWNADLETAAVALLESTENRLVADAARVLGSHGSAAVKTRLFDRLVKWEAEWRGRAGELVWRPGEAEPPAEVEYALSMALLENARIGLTPQDLARILALCVTDNCRRNVEARVRR